MEVLNTFLDFYEVSCGDTRIGPTHISLYMALLGEWNLRCFEMPLVISRDKLVCVARVGRKTYNKCMKELQAYGYIKYPPSFNPAVQSRVWLAGLD